MYNIASLKNLTCTSFVLEKKTEKLLDNIPWFPLTQTIIYNHTLQNIRLPAFYCLFGHFASLFTFCYEKFNNHIITYFQGNHIF